MAAQGFDQLTRGVHVHPVGLGIVDYRGTEERTQAVEDAVGEVVGVVVCKITEFVLCTASFSGKAFCLSNVAAMRFVALWQNTAMLLALVVTANARRADRRSGSCRGIGSPTLFLAIPVAAVQALVPHPQSYLVYGPALYRAREDESELLL